MEWTFCVIVVTFCTASVHLVHSSEIVRSSSIERSSLSEYMTLMTKAATVELSIGPRRIRRNNIDQVSDNGASTSANRRLEGKANSHDQEDWTKVQGSQSSSFQDLTTVSFKGSSMLLSHLSRSTTYPTSRYIEAANIEGLIENMYRSIPTLNDLNNLLKDTCGALKCEKGICGITTRDKRPCYCDDQCVFFSDCCADFEETCQVIATTNETDIAGRFKRSSASESLYGQLDSLLAEVRGQNQAQQTIESNEPTVSTTTSSSRCLPESYDVFYRRQVPQNYLTCLVYHFSNGIFGANVVTACPRVLPDGVQSEDADKCRFKQLQEAPWKEVYLVVIGNIAYLNYYCALCHMGKEALDHADKRVIYPSFSCDDENFAINLALLRLNKTDNFINSLINSCTPTFHGDVMRVLLEARQCVPDVIERCNNTYEHVLTNYSDIERACLVYSQPVRFETTNSSVYKNIHCAICNGRSLNETFSFEKYASRDSKLNVLVPSFSILLDFTSEAVEVRVDKTVLCETKREILNIVTNTCERLTCPPGQVLFNASQCVVAPDNLFYYSRNQNRTLNITIYFAQHILVQESSAFLQFLNDYFLQLEYNFLGAVDQFVLTDIAARCMKHPENTPVPLNASISCLSIISVPTFDKFAETIFHFQSNLVSNIIPYLNKFAPIKDIEVKSGFLSPGHSCIQNADLVHISPVQLVKNLTESYDLMKPYAMYTLVHGGLNVLLPSFGASTDFDKVSLFMTTDCPDPSPVDGDLIQPCLSAQVCVHPMVPCLNHIPQNDSTGSIGAKEEPICISVGEAPVFLSFTQVHGAITTEGIATLIGGILSLSGLTINLITYCMFPNLMTLPGKCLVNLLISLFLAHSLLLCQRLLSVVESICLMATGIQHYMWLVSFSWMNILAYDMYCTFKTTTHGFSPSEKDKKYKKYIAYGWLAPLCIILPCITLDWLGKLQYSNVDTCWISSDLLLGLTFGLPVACILALNFYFFVGTFKGLNNAMNHSSLARTYRRKQRLEMSVKLCSIMGFTWIFGFLSNINGLSFLRYAFVVCGSMQGVFICIAFVSNRNLRQLYRDKIKSLTSSKDNSGNRTKDNSCPHKHPVCGESARGIPSKTLC